MDLFSNSANNSKPPVGANAPLAELLRPDSLDGFIGQTHLVGPDGPIRKMIEADKLHSLILWGPPGCGKTTLAQIIANQTQSDFISISAVSAGVKQVREALEIAKQNLSYHKNTILFIDEIHRFNKAQQDALLHSVERGEIVLFGATTENPSFEVINALLSRCRVYVLESHSFEELEELLEKGIEHIKQKTGLSIEIEDQKEFIFYSGGDARALLNSLQIASSLLTPDENNRLLLDSQTTRKTFQKKSSFYDRNGEQHYNIISAFIKSIRGSDPDGAVYWLARMLEGGEDPKFIARRMIILASEDIGNAQPFGLSMATDCFTACTYIGMPEARIILSQTATYLACAPKSNAAYMAVDAAWDDVRRTGDLPVPIHLRNSPTKLMKEIGYGQDYKYSHDFKDHFVNQQYLPDQLQNRTYYEPTENGREKHIKDLHEHRWPNRKKPK